MCGIAGLLHSSPMDRTGLQRHVANMADVLQHRGPDDSGVWVDERGRMAFGFRRLSILDLSEAGHQPMISSSGRFVMVFNGEVYNFPDLRRVLASHGVRFRGTSDSEVLLAAFDTWGIDETLPKLVGMFACALWDRERDELVLIRDRLGIKPLYVGATRLGVAFASELGALMQAPGFERTLDPDAIVAYLRYLFIPAPKTPFRGVRKLPPGHMLRIPLNTPLSSLPESVPYWCLADVSAGGLGNDGGGPVALERVLDEFEELLAESVRMRLVADVPVGALLSGGLDSTLIVALMQRVGSGQARTFTIGFDEPEFDESQHARAVAQHLGTIHSELRVSGADALKVVPELPRIFDEPLADPSQVPTYLVSRLARQHVTVALSGDGGDELFAGYNRYVSGVSLVPWLTRTPTFARRWLGSLVRAAPPSIWDRLQGKIPGGKGSDRLKRAGHKAHKIGRMLGAPDAASMYRTLLSAWDEPEALVRGGSPGWDPIQAQLRQCPGRVPLALMLLTDQRFYLPDDLLQKVDRASMAVGLEARVPLLDHRVVEFSWRLPEDLKIRNRQGKWLMRRVLDRYVPTSLVDRPKTGFSVPVDAWLRGPLREWAETLLFNEAPLRDEVFEPAVVAREWNRFVSGRADNALGLWAILMFEAWRDEWGINNLLE